MEELYAIPRRQIGKGPARRLRASGYIPAIVYGKNSPAFPIAVEKKAFLEFLRLYPKKGLLFHLVLRDSGSEEKKYPAIVKEIQRHFLQWTLQHIDFHAVHPEEVIEVEVPITVEGKWELAMSAGSRLARRTLRIKGMAKNLPASISFDVDTVPEGSRMLVRDLRVPEGVTILSPEDDVVLFR